MGLRRVLTGEHVFALVPYVCLTIAKWSCACDSVACVNREFRLGRISEGDGERAFKVRAIVVVDVATCCVLL